MGEAVVIVDDDVLRHDANVAPRDAAALHGTLEDTGGHHAGVDGACKHGLQNFLGGHHVLDLQTYVCECMSVCMCMCV